MKFLGYLLAFVVCTYLVALAITWSVARVRSQQDGFDVEVRQGLKALERLANGRENWGVARKARGVLLSASPLLAPAAPQHHTGVK